MKLWRLGSRLAVVVLLLAVGLGAENTPPLSFVRTDDDPRAVVFDRIHNRFFISIPTLNRVDVVSASDGARVKRLLIPGASGLDITPDGKFLIVGTGDGFSYGTEFFYVVDTGSLEVVRRVPVPLLGTTGFRTLTPQEPVALANGTVLWRVQEADLTSNLLAQWDIETGVIRQLQVPEIHGGFGQMRASGNRQRVVIAEGSSGARMALYDASSGQFIATTSFFGNFIQALALNHDGSLIAVRLNCCELILLDGNLNELRRISTLLFSPGLLFSADGTMLYVGREFGGALLDVYDLQLQVRGQLLGRGGPVRRLGLDNRGNLFGVVNRGIAVQRIQMRTETPDQPVLAMPDVVRPGAGPLTTATARAINGNHLAAPLAVYFGRKRAPSARILSRTQIEVVPPAGDKPGPVDVVVQMANGWDALVQEGYSYGPHILYWRMDGGPTQGGTEIEIIGYGFNHSASEIQVTVGGRAATIANVSAFAGISPFFLNINRLRIMTPPGESGPADLTVTTPFGSHTIPNGFHYYATTTVPMATTVGELKWDRWRQRLYVSDWLDSTIHVYDPELQIFTSGFASGRTPVGLSLTPDGSHLLSANWGGKSISVFSLADGRRRDFDLNFTWANFPARTFPESIVATADHKAFVGAPDLGMLDNAYTVEVDLLTGDQKRLFPGNLLQTGTVLFQQLAGGRRTLVGYAQRQPRGDAGGLAEYDAATGSFRVLPRAGNFDDLAATTNGQVRAHSLTFFDSANRLSSSIAFFELIEGWPVPRVFGQRLHPGGGLLFVPLQQGIWMFDVQSGARVRRIGTPSPNVFTFSSMEIDDSGDRLFLATAEGLLTVELGPLPLTVGTLSPEQARQDGGTPVIVRGSGFRPGAQVYFGDVLALATYVDPMTLLVQTPPLAIGQHSVRIRLPEGESYTRHLAFTSYAEAPVITGANPVPVPIGLGDVRLTVHGWSFLPGASVEWNGVPLATEFYSQGVLMATVPGEFLESEAVANVSVGNPGGTRSADFQVELRHPPGRLLLASHDLWVGGVLVGEQGQVETLVSNWGAGPLLDIQVSTSGDFSAINNCPAFLPHSSHCPVTIVLAPTATGHREGILRVASGTQAQEMRLRGAGMEPGPFLHVRDWFQDTLEARVGSGQDSAVTVFNLGDAPATIHAVDASPQFTASAGCTTILPGNACGIKVTFNPSQVGPAQGTVEIVSDATNSSLRLDFSGTGLLPIWLSNSEIDFQRVLVGQLWERIVTLRNGSETLAVPLTSFSVSGGFTVLHECANPLPANASCTVRVHLTPLHLQEYKGVLTVSTPYGNLAVPVRAGTTDFQIARAPDSPISATVNAGQQAAFRAAVRGLGGFASSLQMTCTAPASITCAVSPVNLQVDSSGADFIANVTVTTSGTLLAARQHQPPASPWTAVALMLPLALVMVASVGWRVRTGWLLCCALLLGLAACGFERSGEPGTPFHRELGITQASTQRGTYVITVTARTLANTRSVNFFVTVD